ncbi:hypothetical protein Micbo1qcDRAFT_206728 [Microdochium bolleyi]|uniref:Uncharacterized protein n=1 Tax=Microdochium bolleyi TaxID=196109 RepID=A0A136IWL0_9PEZI|nr:hypothetical protein Micbo1qcDRAFT_206728 [Microdochium bolleyi]
MSGCEETAKDQIMAQLYNMAVVIDKYDCIEVLSPWSTQLLRFATAYQYQYHALAQHDLENVGQELWVFWVLGHRYHFLHTFESLIGDCSINEQGGFVTSSGRKIFDGSS